MRSSPSSPSAALRVAFSQRCKLYHCRHFLSPALLSTHLSSKRGSSFASKKRVVSLTSSLVNAPLVFTPHTHPLSLCFRRQCCDFHSLSDASSPHLTLVLCQRVVERKRTLLHHSYLIPSTAILSFFLSFSLFDAHDASRPLSHARGPCAALAGMALSLSQRYRMKRRVHWRNDENEERTWFLFFSFSLLLLSPSLALFLFYARFFLFLR